MATIREVLNVEPIEKADAIEKATVDGWQVIVKKGEFSKGDRVVYFEIDSCLPLDNELFEFLTNRGCKEIDGKYYHVLKTVKLRGQISQGFVIPYTGDGELGNDVSEEFGVFKYEPPIPAQLGGKVKGNFPSFLKKTDEERVQNMMKYADEEFLSNTFTVTEKLDGSSFTAYLKDGVFGVCSRNLDLTRDENNSFWKWAIENDLERKMRYGGANIALQGELIGEGIQGNKYKIKGQKVVFFNVYSIDSQEYIEQIISKQFITQILGYEFVPVISELSEIKGKSIEDLLNQADRKSEINPNIPCEGLVFRSDSDPNKSFKVINNKFLLKYGG